MSIAGVDVSAYQGEINYEILKLKTQFMYIRAAWAKNEDAWLRRNVSEAARVGIPCGLYFVPSPGGASRSWEVQANYHASLYLAFPGQMLPVLDIETDGGLTKAELENWLVKYHRQFLSAAGIPEVMIYTSSGFWNYQMPLGDVFWRCPLWLADYTPPANVPYEWSNHKRTFTLWQTGIYKPATNYGCPPPPLAAAGIDQDTFPGNEADFEDFFGVPPAELPVVPPTPSTRVAVVATINPRTRPVIDPSTDAGTITAGAIFDKAGLPSGGFQPVKVWLSEKYLEDLP